MLKSTNPVEPVNVHAWTSTDALRSGSTATIALADMVNAIELSGIEVQIYHGEAAPGQVCSKFLIFKSTTTHTQIIFQTSFFFYLF